MTNFPGGIQGSPVIGANHFGWKHKSAHASRVWVVDGISGSDGAEGDSPDSALRTVGRAIFLASAYDVIYVLDKGLSGTDPNPYREAIANLSIAYAKNNLALIGVPHNIHELYGLQIKAALVLTTPILSVSAPFTVIENLDFNGTGDALARGNIYFADDGDTINQAQGSSVYNCHLRNGKGSAGVATMGGGIVIHGGWHYIVKGCRFDRCRCGIWMSSKGATIQNNRIEDNLFTTSDLAVVDKDIHMATAAESTVIARNYFAHDIGSYGSNLYATLTGSGGLLNNYFAHAAVEAKAAGADIVIPATFRMAGNFDEAGIIVRAS